MCFAVSLELIISNHWDRIISPLINVPILKRVYILNDLVCMANAKLLNTIITMTETISRRVRRYRRGTCSLGHCFVCPSLIYGFWLPLRYLVAIVLSVLLWFTDSDYPFGILWPLCCLSFFDLRILITPSIPVEHIRGQLWHRYSVTVNQVMVETVKFSKWWLQLNK